MTVESQTFTDAIDGDLVVTLGEKIPGCVPLVRIHSECVFAEAFDSSLCDCNDQLHLALTQLKAEGYGILFYLRLDGRGIGLSAKVAATALEVAGDDTYESRVRLNLPPEGRSFESIGKYLAERSILSVRLLSNNPLKAEGLLKFGIKVEMLPLIPPALTKEIRRLYTAKALKFRHLIPGSAYEADDEAE
jgi:GTP cyclohydrolase II